jgi:hypothetical protein
MGMPIETSQMNTETGGFTFHFGSAWRQFTGRLRGTRKMNTCQAKIGYACASTFEQNLDAQMAALKRAGFGMVRTK